MNERIRDLQIQALGKHWLQIFVIGYTLTAN